MDLEAKRGGISSARRMSGEDGGVCVAVGGGGGDGWCVLCA